MEKRYERKRLERIIIVYLLHSNVYFTDQNIMQRGDPAELNFESIEMHKWYKPINRAVRVDEKSGVICVVIMFIPTVMVIKKSKLLFFVFSTDNSKKISHSLWKIFTGNWRSYRVLLRLTDRGESSKRYKKSVFPGLTNASSESSYLWYFLKELNKIFLKHLSILPKLVQILYYQQ